MHPDDLVFVMVSSFLLSQGIFRMIRDGDFVDHETFQKATKQTSKNFGFWKERWS
jgi:hypothetical protein